MPSVAGVLLALAIPLAQASSCKGTLYLTLDTGNMAYAEAVAQTLRRHDVRATFFLANERTTRGDHALDATWQDYWRARVAEGHRFGTHTWRHGKVVGDAPDGSIRYRPEFPPGPVETLPSAAYCAELKRVDDAFRGLTGRALDPLWRAPGRAHQRQRALGRDGLRLPTCRLERGGLPRRRAAVGQVPQPRCWSSGRWRACATATCC